MFPSSSTARIRATSLVVFTVYLPVTVSLDIAILGFQTMKSAAITTDSTTWYRTTGLSFLAFSEVVDTSPKEGDALESLFILLRNSLIYCLWDSEGEGILYTTTKSMRVRVSVKKDLYK